MQKQMQNALTYLIGIITVLISIITVLILYQQMKTNRYKYKLDLYDKRFKVYNALREFLGKILTQGIENISNGDLVKFNISTKESIFLLIRILNVI